MKKDNTKNKIYEQMSKLSYDDFEKVIAKFENNIEQQPDSFKTLIGKIEGETEIIEAIKWYDEEKANFTVVSRTPEGNIYTKCTVSGDKGDINSDDFREGNFIELKGRINVDNRDKNKIVFQGNIINFTLIKEKNKDRSIPLFIKKTKEKIERIKLYIEEREKDKYYADSFQQSSQISDDIIKHEKILKALESELEKIVNEKEEKPSIFDKIKENKEKLNREQTKIEKNTVKAKTGQELN